MKINLVPTPQNLVVTDEMTFSIQDYGRIFLSGPEADPRLKSHLEYMFQVICQSETVFPFHCLHSEGMDVRDIDLGAGAGKNDFYKLTLDRTGFLLAAPCAAGLFYGLQTLKQLLAHEELPALEIEDWADVGLRSDYLDLRNVFPPFERMLSFIRELSYCKINTLVVEYEDKLPFETMGFLRHPSDCFTEEEFSALLSTAEENFIEVIPLQQSFGHLEYVLKYPEYIHLRETPGTPGEMCPLRPGALELSKALISEMAALHPDSKYLHIGCDEVWSLGSSAECRESGKTREVIFIEYVNHLIDHVCSLGKMPIIWHDMFRNASEEELALLDNRVLVAVWLYNGSDMPFRAKEIMMKLERAGIAYLGCSSVSCWDSCPEQNYPVIDNRLLNLDLWGRLAKETDVKGLIHTRWASSFSLGRPYGLFETHMYPLFYGADLSWNEAADRSDFLYRFLFLYHGMDTARVEEEGYRNRDYYLVVCRYHQDVSKHKETAYLIYLLISLENSFPVRHTMYRCELYPDSEVERACLKERSEAALRNFHKVRGELTEFIPRILNESMGKMFLESRFYLYDMAEERLRTIL